MSEEGEKDFREYVEKYCRKHKISPEEAEKHYLVRAYKSYLEERDALKGVNNDGQGMV